jgi:hypothetical protein
MSECNYRPTGELQGDTKPFADKGTGTGMNGDTYGASLDQDATNSTGMGSAAKSDGKEGI